MENILNKKSCGWLDVNDTKKDDVSDAEYEEK